MSDVSCKWLIRSRLQDSLLLDEQTCRNRTSLGIQCHRSSFWGQESLSATGPSLHDKSWSLLDSALKVLPSEHCSVGLSRKVLVTVHKTESQPLWENCRWNVFKLVLGGNITLKPWSPKTTWKTYRHTHMKVEPKRLILGGGGEIQQRIIRFGVDLDTSSMYDLEPVPSLSLSFPHEMRMVVTNFSRVWWLIEASTTQQNTWHIVSVLASFARLYTQLDFIPQDKFLEIRFLVKIPSLNITWSVIHIFSVKH